MKNKQYHTVRSKQIKQYHTVRSKQIKQYHTVRSKQIKQYHTVRSKQIKQYQTVRSKKIQNLNEKQTISYCQIKADPKSKGKTNNIILSDQSRSKI